MKKKVISSIVALLVIAFALSSCAEHRYYQKNQRHTDRYEQRHHREARAGVGVDLNIHN
jgi:hypothetical protein